jgi:aspartate-semialdehyde dehydrogenase
MKKVGFVGSRGMVGSVLLSRMQEENDFEKINPVFFSTSKIGSQVSGFDSSFSDANNLELLSEMEVIVTCQGGEYSQKIYPLLRNSGWQGYWIDSSSYLRMHDDSIIILDPINGEAIEQGLNAGIKNYIGGNCTTSLMLMALAGLFKEDLIEWLTTMTYQSASGAGSKVMGDLVDQMKFISSKVSVSAADALSLDAQVNSSLFDSAFPVGNTKVPLATSLIPWIDDVVDDGQTREEKKAFVEVNKILQTKVSIPISGICVRVGTMRCHSQAFTIKLKKDLSLNEIENVIAGAHEWVNLIPNNREDTVRRLTPAAVSGTLDIAVGRVRKLNLGPEYLTLFTVGDQLLWGAAEPLRRVLARIVLI